MKNRMKKWLAFAIMVMGILQTGTMTVFAEGEAAQTEPAAEQVLPETAPDTGSTPFSVPGNGQIVDDKTDDGTKQFITVQTKSGSTFFLVIDRAGATDNVYMLSKVDENDLAEFTKDGGQAKTEGTMPQVALPETTASSTEAAPALSPEPEKPDKSSGAVVAIVLLAAGILGGIYYVKVVKPKKAGEESDEENLEICGGGDQDYEPDEDD